jgi:putative colanic acid polymerase
MLWSTISLNAKRASIDDLLPAVAFGCLISIVVLCIAQVTVGHITGSDVLYNPFGSHQYLYALDMTTASAGGLVRAKGFFLEPSFCALVLLTLWLVCILRNYRVVATSIIAALGIIATASVVGLLACAAFVVVFWATGRHRFWWGTLMPLLGVCALAGIIAFGSSSYMSRRLLEIQIPGTSGYRRVTAPLSMMRETLTFYPTGILLGGADQYVASFGVLHGAGVGLSVDNGIQLLVFYFGWFGLAAVIALFCSAVVFLLRRDRQRALVAWYSLLALLFTGGVLVPEYVFLQILVLQAGRKSRETLTPGIAGALSAIRR